MYNAIVVGAGHAGCEASLALSRLNKKTLLITGNKEYVASMPCNPSVGGPAKGILVREIDALGGEMGINTDKTYIQMRLLNSSAGPAVQALRAQSDKYKYHEEMLKTIENTENLTLTEGYVKSLITEGNIVKGVVLEDGRMFEAKTVILTTGTYLNSVCFRGEEKTFSGPENQKTYSSLSNNLKELGFNIIRLKTGTPPRVLDSSIDYSLMSRQDGDIDNEGFSYRTKEFLSLDKQVPCYLIHTTKETHKIIFDNLEKSALYGGEITGIGPRYCPSIETKLVRFKDKESHQVFVEPVSLSSHKMYLQGFSTSMPEDIQMIMVKSLPGFKNAEIIEYAYAIEYDALDPLDMKASLESKIIKGLFTAGQINGTSGYEEAAAQGIMAGINASLFLDKKEPLILRRDEAYIGVLIDDLVTKGVEDPYRMLTSRAEYRLLLRHDNADTRLSAYGHEVGLLSDEDYNEFLKKEETIKKEKEFLKETFITGKKEVNEKALNMGVSLIKDKISLYDLIKRPDYDFKKVLEIASLSSTLDSNTIRQIEIDIKYEGYIKKAEKQAEDFRKVEKIKIPEDIDYNKIKNIASEAKEKLEKIRPLNVSQASRISGVNPADISILLVYLKSKGKR
ncbi:MAG: tRNA uridine-5-carboxymethylaminomethyl(34) synthesis enzyme MnmG [Bacillales bacterium]|nr:tRNA uridine-5-carboxymethylaminomethyl(34) synthesis enzyme MnmG [Bacillales bacterium]